MKRNDSVIPVLRAGLAVAAYNIPIGWEDDVTVFQWAVRVVRVESLIWWSFFIFANGLFLDDLEDVLSFENGEDAATKCNHGSSKGEERGEVKHMRCANTTINDYSHMQ